MQIERPKTSQKNIIDCNLPFQIINRYSLSTILIPFRSSLKEDTKRKSMAKGEQVQQYQQEVTSRSNSIHGRKLSFCDAHLTVSQNTLEPAERIAVTQRNNREENNQSQLYANGSGVSQQQYSSFLINQSQSESLLNLKNQPQQHMHPIGSRGKNPRQSKEPQKKKKRLQQNTSTTSNGTGGQAQNSNKLLQKAIKQQFKLYQQSQKKNGINISQQQPQRSPLQEKKYSVQQNYQPVNAYEGAKIPTKNASNRNPQQPASFMLTFSKDKSNSPNQKASTKQEKENHKVYVNMEREGIINIIEQKQKQISQQQQQQQDISYYKNNPSISNQRTLSSGKKKKPKSQQSSKERRYSSPSPNSNGVRSSLNKLQQNNSYIKNSNNNRQSVENVRMRSYIDSGEKDRSGSKNIDQLVRNNIKRQKEIEIKQQEAAAQQMEQLSQRKLKIVVKNKEIRNRNFLKNQIKMKKAQISNLNDEKQEQQTREKLRNEYQDRHIEMKSKSPLKIWQELQKEKNKDMPLKIQAKRNKKQLGLEIFDLKKELGMKIKQLANDPNSIEQSTYRKLLNKKELKAKNNNNNIQDLSSVIKPVEAEPNQVSSKNKKVHQTSHDEKDKQHPDMQKLILKQNKKRNKQEKQQKFQEFIKHKKVIENLKSLNKIIGLQRKKMIGQGQVPARNETENNKKHFKTVQEQQIIQQIKNFDKHMNQDRSVSRASQGLNDKDIIVENKNKHQNTISARRLTLGPAAKKLKAQENPSSSRVVYSFVSQGKQVVVKKKSSQSKNKKSLKKEKLIQMLLEQLQNHQSLSHQQSVDNHGLVQKRSLKKKRRSLNAQSRSKSKYNKSVIQHQQQHLQGFSIDSPELRLKKRRKSKQENGVSRRQFDNDFSNLGSSRSLNNSPTKSTKEQGRGSSLLVPTAKVKKQSVPMKKEVDDQQSDQDEIDLDNPNDQIELNDEMMIFCVLNTAASIIQKNFRHYISKKKEALLLIQRQLLNKKDQRNENIIKEEVKMFQDSANLENRIIPSKESKENENQSKLNQVQQQRKQSKYTPSFGNDVQSQVAQLVHSNFNSFYQDNDAQKSGNNTSNSQSTNNRRETSPVDDKTPLGRGNGVFQYNNQDLFKLNFIQDEQSQQVSSTKQREEEGKKNEEVKYDTSSDQVEEEELKRVLNIDGKLKKAMQNLVSQQKSTTFLEQLKRKQNKGEKKELDQQKQRYRDEGIINVNDTKIKTPKPQQAQEQSSQLDNKNNDSFNLLQKHLDQNESMHMEEKEIDLSHISIEVEDQQQQVQGENNVSILNEENIMMMNNNSEGDMSQSLLASFGEGTDKIICESPINTNEEILEAAVNESNTLNNEESGINESNLLQQSRVEDSQLNIQVFQSEKGLRGDNNNSLLLDGEGNEGFNYDNGARSNQVGATTSDRGDNQHQVTERNQTQLKQKPMLRLMFGDEQYLKLQEEQDVISYDRELGSNQDFFGSGPSSNRLLQSENPYFLATNASIFERNPFKEFTSNKLSEILAGKNAKELLEMKEDAIKYQEKIEKGFINRLERKQELSPISSQRRKYELECWVTNERKTLQQSQKEKQLMSQPLNVFDLEKERKEAARIIEQVNKKVTDIKGKVTGKQKDDFKVMMAMRKKQFENLNELEDENINKNQFNSQVTPNQYQLEEGNVQFKSQQQQPFTMNNFEEYMDNKLPELYPQIVAEQAASPLSDSRLDLSQEIKRQQQSKMPDLNNLNKDGDIMKEDIPTVLLEISFEDDEEEIDIPETEEQKEESTKKSQIQDNSVKKQYVDQITQQIFELFLNQELKKNQIIPIRQEQPISSFAYEKDKQNPSSNLVLKELQAVQIVDDFYEPYQNLKTEESQKQAPKVSKEKEINEQMLTKPKQTLDVVIQDNQIKPLKPLGIDTSEEAILKYIEDIFDQIRSRKDLFMQAFATPIYKNPLEVLSNLQRPVYGDLEMTTDLSNSLSCILNVQLYLTLEKARDNLIHQTIQQIKQQNLERNLGTQNGSIPTEEELTDLISESQHIHNKIIFDCVNEALNSVRPYSIAGEPMPWSTKAKKNLIFLLDDQENINKILVNVRTKVMQWSRTKAGALPPRYPEYQYSQQQMEAIMQMDEELFSQQREKCLAQMLARDLVEGEERWLDYEMEEAQVKIDLSDIVLEQLVGEVCTLLQDIKASRQT